MNISKNRFFKLALNRATKLAGKPGRIVALLVQLTIKIQKTKGTSFTMHRIREHFLLIGRMLKSHINGTYKIRSMRILIIILAAIIYFLNPLDLIPDFIFGIGLADDLAVLTLIYRAAATEIESFRCWEKSPATTIAL